MNVAIFEVCRSPEIKKETEAIIFSNFFNQQGINYEVYSNDGIWLEKTILNKEFMRQCLKKPDLNVVHLAMHGNDNSIVFKWSKAKNIKDWIVEDSLTSFDIRNMSEWHGKLVVSGACSLAKLANYFLEAGAKNVIAPENLIDWTNLGKFFKLFYMALNSGQSPMSALALSK